MIAIYLRLSMSDGDLGDENKDESNSIENQRLLLRRYLEEREDLVGEIKEYIDDGYSGTNFNRPGFQRMIEDCKKGIIHTILVKDLSRLGRNYIGVGDYVEQLFPLLGIRFIAVNHNYDSNDYIGETMGFDMEVNNLISTFYSRDLSRKRKSTNQIKWKQGIATAAYAPFGYKKDKRNKGKWLVDPEAAEIIRIIFKKACEGYNTTAIAAYLNENNIETALKYNERHKVFGNLNTQKAKSSEQIWDNNKVHRVLNRYEYTGAFVAGRKTPVHMGSSKVRLKDESEWTVIDDVNEPIVTKEEFAEARKAVRVNKKREYMLERKYVLKGKLRCGNCRLRLVYEDSTIEKKYYCGHARKTGKYSKCCKDAYPENLLENMIFSALRNLFRVLHFVGIKAEQQHQQEMKLYREVDIKKLDNEIKLWKAKKIRQYEAYAEGHMGKEVYLYEKQVLNDTLNRLITERDSAELRRMDSDKRLAKTKEITEQSNEFLGETELTREMVKAFIDTVYVYDLKHIKIIYKFEDEIQSILNGFMGKDETADDKE